MKKRKPLESQLQKAQMMHAISSLSGGIAHQLNNALAALSGNIDLLRIDRSDKNKVNVYTSRMKDSINNMVGLTGQLLAYSEGGKYQPRILSPGHLIENTIPLILPKIDPLIRVETDVHQNISHVNGDQTQLQMVLSAIVTNAAETISGKGCIRITIRNKQVGMETAKKHPDLKPGPHVCIKVKDNGKGMDKVTLDRIFNPIFTTNFQGRGLGMSAVYGIIENHNGHIKIESQPEKGTIVSIFLPAAARPIKKLRQQTQEVSKGVGTILLVEDEEMVMVVCRTMLEKMGYLVLSAETGKQAADTANGHKGQIDLAILDIGLPDMGGRKVYRLLKKARPALKVIVCSGYACDGAAKEVMDAGAQAFIQKPFSFKLLAREIRKLVERRRHKRHTVKAGVAVMPATDSAKQLNLTNISKGGLSFQYHETDEWPNEFTRLTLSDANKISKLDNIPCRIVAEYSPEKKSLTRSEDKKMKRLGIQFGELTPDQKNQIDLFITNNATDKP